ncbi:MAG: CRISPR system precrRNA processing endoribonuclease RAMP protein Cas6 [Deltaproteobacteria bacterium]|nr:CRISPR system precrRNA processing endoribonuclease RAMP protein Cas6 [Deltaproteobacteria bacterium]
MEVVGTVIGRLEIGIRFNKSGKITGRGGEQIHGFLFKELKRINPQYSEKIHDSEQPSPFSISYLLPDNHISNYGLRDGNLHITEGDSFHFYLGCVDERLLSLFIKLILGLKREEKGIKIGQVPAEINYTGVIEKGKSKLTTYEDLVKKTKSKTKLIIWITTALSFRQNGIQMTFPLPHNVFSSLLNIWNTYAPIKFDNKILEDTKKIMISAFTLKSEVVKFDKYEIFGSRGYFTYDLSRLKGTESLKIFNILAEFSNYSGIGYKRAMGLGIVNTKSS